MKLTPLVDNSDEYSELINNSEFLESEQKMEDELYRLSGDRE
jgi:hypothetical protein